MTKCVTLMSEQIKSLDWICNCSMLSSEITFTNLKIIAEFDISPVDP